MVQQSKFMFDDGTPTPWEITREGFDDEADHFKVKKSRRGRPSQRRADKNAPPRDASLQRTEQPENRTVDPRQEAADHWPLPSPEASGAA